MSRIITGPMSEVLDAGRTSRTFSAAARRAIAARDQHCIWPGCTAPAAWCEAHHGIHWIDDGPSDVDNGYLLCGAHHDRVHKQNKTLVINPDGSRTVDIYSNSVFDGTIRDLRTRPPDDG